VGPATALLALLSLLSIAGCDSRKATPTAPTAPPTPIGTATVSGTVTFRGPVPPGEQVQGADCHPGAGTLLVKPVHVSGDGRLMDVVVSLKGAVGGAKGAPPAGGPVLLDQVGCEYVPHAVALRVGQVLRVRSSDPTLHNVHGLGVENEAFNFGMVAAGQTVDKTFGIPESFKVKCDVHPWMSASVNVFDHAFYAVTDAAGKYEIHNLPAGRQTLVFRHDFLGEVEVDVVAESGKTTTADVVFGRAQ
jgi:plastocyanin